ncbi:hypothetical protein ACHWQZ_G006720 [Mnemiopsis leidyi]
MLRYNQSYGYSKKYQDNNSTEVTPQQRQKANEKTKKLCIENKKRRRQFEERQRIHERNEEKRREAALSSRRRRQQEATNAYKAALNKELNKRSKTPISRVSSASSTGSQRGRHIYRSPTVDEVLSNIRGHALGGSLRTYGESSNTPGRSVPVHNVPVHNVPVHNVPVHNVPVHNVPVHNVPVHNVPVHTAQDYTPISSYTSPTYAKNVISFNSRPELLHCTKLENYNEKVLEPAPVSVTQSRDAVEEEILRDSLETVQLSPKKDKEEESVAEIRRDSDPDRIRVQIDLTKFDQLEVSDCESNDPTEDYAVSRTSSDKYVAMVTDRHTESYTDLSKLVPQKSVQLIQHEDVSSRAISYFGPSSGLKPCDPSPSSTLRTCVSDPDLSYKCKTTSPSSVQSMLNSAEKEETPNYSIQTSGGESFIYCDSTVEAVKVASATARTTAWSASDKLPPSPGVGKHLKSLIKRTPSAKRKQVRWDSVSALDDETMEVDQFDISSEGEAVFTRQYSHPPRPTTTYDTHDTPYPDTGIVNLQRTPTDAEINALWNKVRTTLHRNQAWDTPQSKTTLPLRVTHSRKERDVPPKMQDSLRIYSNVVMDTDRYKLKRHSKSPGHSTYGPNVTKMTEVTENGHTMLSMEEQRILQSLERLDAKLKDSGTSETTEPKTQIVTFSSPTLEISRPPNRNETYKRLLNRKTNGLSTKYR